jgi:hypothetical protein
MSRLQVNFSSPIFSVLSRYPGWLEMIIQAIDKPLFSLDYCPEVIEVFDQHGLLTGRVHGCLSYECRRNINEESEFIAWLIDGELAVFYVDSKLVINRLQLLAVAFGELV